VAIATARSRLDRDAVIIALQTGSLAATLHSQFQHALIRGDALSASGTAVPQQPLGALHAELSQPYALCARTPPKRKLCL